MKKIKKAYRKPKVVYERTLETLAEVCDAKDGAFESCKTDAPCDCLRS